MYSNMLYMKTRITFRIAPELADALRELPNQTTIVERVLRDALGRACPLCDGRGRLPRTDLEISDFREAELPPLEREAALQLKQVVRLGRELAATRLELSGDPEGPVGYRLARGKQVLLTGALDERASSRPH
jgi:hypothetical protein